MVKYIDAELWNDFKNGDDYAFSLIYSKFSKKLYTYGLKLTSNSTLVEDSIQDLFSDLAKNRKNLGATSNIQFYLIKSFKRKLFRQIHKEKRYNLDNNEQQFGFEITYSIEHDLILEENTLQRLHLLKKAIDTLTSRQKEALYLRFTEEFEYEMISEIMNMSVESCRNLLYRTIKNLRETLRESASSLSLLFLLMKH